MADFVSVWKTCFSSYSTHFDHCLQICPSAQLVLRFGSYAKAGAVQADPIDIPLAIDRQKFLALNSVASARAFQVICEAVFLKVFGVPLSHKTKSSGVRRRAGLGDCIDFYACFEVQV